MKKFFPIIISIFLVQLAWSQEVPRQVLNGKVSLDHTMVEDIYVLNLQTSKGYSTVSGGYFTIKATAGDTLMFSAINIIGKRIVLTEQNMNEDLLIVRLQLIPNQLDEVKIYNYDHINAVSLGIIPAGQKSYTAAERKLKAGGDFNPVIGTNASLSGDAVINWMSGRAAMLRKELAVEQKESKQTKLEQMFDANYIEQKLQIPADYVRGFIVYVVEEAASINIFSAKDRNAAAFVIAELAVKYKKIIAGENQ